MPLHARTRSVNASHRSGQRITTRRRDRVRVWPSEAASRPMQSSHIAWPHASVVVVGSRHIGQVWTGAAAAGSSRRRFPLRPHTRGTSWPSTMAAGAAVVFVEVFYLGVVERGWVAHLVKARRRRAAVLFPWCGITC